MKRFLLMLGLGAVAALPALPGSCSLTSSLCMSGLSGNKLAVPVSANFASSSMNTIDTLSLSSITFNGNVVKGGTVSLTESPTAVSATLSNVAFAPGTKSVTVGMTFTFAGPDTLSSAVGTMITDGSLATPATANLHMSTLSVSEVVTLDPSGTMFSLSNLFEINQRTPDTVAKIAAKNGAMLYDANGIALFNPNAFATPASAPEPTSIALVGLGLLGGLTLASRRRKAALAKRNVTE